MLQMTPFSPHMTPPRLRTGESMHLVCFWPSTTSMARRERQRGASGVRWWVGTNSPVLCVCRRGVFFRVKSNDPSFDSFDAAPRLRTGESMHLARFWPSTTSRARRERLRGLSGVRWWVGTARFCVCSRRGVFSVYNQMTPFSTHLTPRPVSAQANQCTWLASGLQPHPGRGGNANGGRRECGGGSEQPGCVCVCRRGVFFRVKSNDPSFASFDAAFRLRTGESMHLACFWPSTTSRARRERQRGASGVRWWVGTARFCVQEGCLFPCKIK
jgi:hypothetical protein